MEEAMNQPDGFIQASRSLSAWNIQRGKLFRAIALADPQIETPARENVDRYRIFCDPHGIVERQQQDERADPNPARAYRDRCGKWQDRGIITVVDEMMLGQPDVVIA